MTQLQFAVNSTAAGVREETIGGTNYLVASTVAVKEGVLNGILVTAEELARTLEAWAGRAVPIHHPKDGDNYISANSPQVWASDVTGFLYNPRIEANRLKGEIWVDLAKAEQLGDKATGLVNRLRSGQPIEVSTGYFCEIEQTPGAWNGQPYHGIARNIRPDHLAMLPDETGACSWDDGCGVPRVNERETHMQVNELDLQDRMHLIRRAFGEHMRAMSPGDDMWDLTDVVGIFQDVVIAKNWHSKQHQAYPYTVNEADNSVTFGEPEAVEVVYRAKDGGTEIVVNGKQLQPLTAEVSQSSQYQLIPDGGVNEERVAQGIWNRLSQLFRGEQNTDPEENDDMQKNELVAALTANERCKFDKTKLESWEEADLQALHDSLQTQAQEPEGEPEGGAQEPPAQPEPQANAQQGAQMPQEITEFAAMLKQLGGAQAIGEALGTITANAAAERNGIVQGLLANAQNQLSQAELEALPTETLRKLQNSYAPRDYTGAFGAFVPNQGDDEEVLEMPQAWPQNGGSD